MNVYRVRFTRPIDREPDTILLIANEYRVDDNQVRFYRDQQEVAYFPMPAISVWLEEAMIDTAHRYRWETVVYDQINTWDPREQFEE
jgi:hypothetical protein